MTLRIKILNPDNALEPYNLILGGLLALIVISLLIGSIPECFARHGEYDEILSYGLAAISKRDFEAAAMFKEELLKEAREGAFTGPSHSMKITQTWAMFRGYYYLEITKHYPDLFSEDQRDIIVDWFVKITERAFTVEWSDLYYALAFRKPVTAPYRNQENGTGALVIYAEIIKDKRPDLAERAVTYVKQNAVMWKRNFRNTDDSIFYQSIWIYNCYNVAKVLYPEWSSGNFCKRSFDWIKYQWPPDGSPFGYNPNPDLLVPDIMYLGAHIHKDGTYKWLGNRMLEYASKRKKKISGFRPGLAFRNDGIQPVKPTIGSVYMTGPGGLVQFPSEDRPDKIVFREGWEADDFYAVLNLRFDGWHGYKGTNSFISIRFGEPFVVEDLVKRSWDWLPAGRAKRRDGNICRSRLNGFQLQGSVFTTVLNRVFGFEDSWAQNVVKFATVEDFVTMQKIDSSRTRITNWRGWSNERICLLVKDDYFVVFDFNAGNNDKIHAISWHLQGELNRKDNRLDLRQRNREMSLYLYSNNASLIVKSSSEPYEPESPDFEASYDVRMETVDNHSEMITVFYPKRGNSPLKVEKLDEGNPHMMSLVINTEDFKDTILVKDTANEDNMIHDGLDFDSQFILLRETQEQKEIYYRGGSIIVLDGRTYKLQEPQGTILVRPEQSKK